MENLIVGKVVINKGKFDKFPSYTIDVIDFKTHVKWLNILRSYGQVFCNERGTTFRFELIPSTNYNYELLYNHLFSLAEAENVEMKVVESIKSNPSINNIHINCSNGKANLYRSMFEKFGLVSVMDTSKTTCSVSIMVSPCYDFKTVYERAKAIVENS